MANKSTRYNFLTIFFVALGSFTYGFNSAISGSVLGLASFLNYFNLSTTGPNSTQGNHLIGANNGLFAGGGIIGCLLVPWLLDAAGRRAAIQITSLICVLSAALQAGSVHIGMLLVGRFLNGIAVGMMDVAVPIYQSEISPAKVRGRMVGSHGFLVVVGYIVAPILLLVGSPWMPESPRWLCKVGNTTAARQVLEKLHPDGQGEGHSFADNELQEICAQLELEIHEATSDGWRQVFSKKSYRKRILYGFFVQCIAQSTGVLVVNNYQILLYNGLGLHGSIALLLYACYNSLAAFMNFVNSLILDRWGRIRIMVIGLIGCSLSLCGFTAMVAEFVGTSNNKIGNGFGVFFLYIFVFFYGGSMDASSYVYCAEIFPTSIRAHGVGISVSGLFIMTLIYTQTASTAFESVGWKYYLIFIILPWIGAFVMGKYFPETAGLSLEEIAVLFDDEMAPSPANCEDVKKAIVDEMINATHSSLSTKTRDADVEHAEMREL
ncbi:major facilitator superfamily domain-containing protein [Dactylonectria macrodidyma]|uniref:Major facilitator superfamily domain-containing protein n=1 Tax=Dactylonectria macrodidyma TaxID=307937 RepID=A0A9P9DFR4_9HYPO|nr:major facilitator superfamily domain-containing protein [Dactylonectria macrodidyma]